MNRQHSNRIRSSVKLFALTFMIKGWRRYAVIATVTAVFSAGFAYGQDLVFIKTSNTPSGRVEVHIASAASKYQTRTVETATTFANENDGVWQLLWNHDLVFIKTSNTPSGHVEVHVASAASGYQAKTLETPTAFANENDGVWQLLPNKDLAFIKTSNTENGHVEVHVASAGSDYQAITVGTATAFPNENDGVWRLLVNKDLAFIKTANTPSGHVEVHIASAGSSYQTITQGTATTFANEHDGVWQLCCSVPYGGLVFIKTSNTPSGRVEVHIASSESNYQTRTLETATTFANENDGVWDAVGLSAENPNKGFDTKCVVVAELCRNYHYVGSGKQYDGGWYLCGVCFGS